MSGLARWIRTSSVVAVAAVPPAFAGAQGSTGTILPGVKAGGSQNLKVLAHIPLGGFFRAGDLTVEQEASRPYAYVGQMLDRAGFAILDLRNPGQARVIYRWAIPGAAAHRGLGGVRPRYFKSAGRYFLVQGFQFTAGSPDDDLAAIVFDVTGLPDTSRVREVARIRVGGARGGVRDLFAYKHSDGRALLFLATGEPRAPVYDLDAVVASKGAVAPVAAVPIPDAARVGGAPGYNAVTAALEASTNRDVFYGAGAGGYYVYDVTDLRQPRLLTSVVGASGVVNGTSIAPSPDGRFVVTGTDYQYSPMRLFDLSEGLAGKAPTISRTTGAWTPDWHDASRRAEVRWPFVFVASYEDGLEVFNMVNPANPQTVGWYFTCLCAHESGLDPETLKPGNSVMNGALGVDVRNSDGLVAVSDANSGFWLLRMEGFGGWNGNDWGVPNVSSAQDWDRATPRRFVP